MADSFDDWLLDQARGGQEVVEECRSRRADEAGDQVDRYILCPESCAAGDRLDRMLAPG